MGHQPEKEAILLGGYEIFQCVRAKRISQRAHGLCNISHIQSDQEDWRNETL